jgi:CRISPR type IV-associated protein Csf3
MNKRLTVIGEVAAPIVLQPLARFTPLDSQLAYAAVARLKAERSEVALGEVLDAVANLPLKKIPIKNGEDWLYAASVPSFVGETPIQGDGISTIYKAMTANALKDVWDKERIVAGLKSHLNQPRGPNKSCVVRLPIMVATHIKWTVEGDKEGIEDLLSDITHFGKKVSLGYGLLRGFRVEVTPDAKIHRPLPDEFDVQPPIIPLRLKPAYWLTTGRHLAGMGVL